MGVVVAFAPRKRDTAGKRLPWGRNALRLARQKARAAERRQRLIAQTDTTNREAR